jgi:uncharacterized membrane protein (DUF4010 family)
MGFTEQLAVRIAIALGIGLLIGAERERRKSDGPGRSAAGIRTFGLVSLVGALSLSIGGEALLVVSGIAVAGLTALGYRQTNQKDPGLTSEMALFTTFFLGALCMTQPALASGLAVTVSILLASRTRLHRFVRHVLTAQEAQDALLFGAAALVILPLAPNRAVDPFGVLNPRTLWRLVVLVMAISTAGYISLRVLGPRYGLPISGFVSGFISSAATISSMGNRAVREPAMLRGAVAGAVLSTVATFVQMAALLLVTDKSTLRVMTLPLLLGGGTAVLYGLLFTWRSARGSQDVEPERGRAFNLTSALAFVIVVTGILLISAAINQWLGSAGLLFATAVAGFADAHAPTIAVASMAAAGKISVDGTTLPIVFAITANTITKAVLAVIPGNRQFALEVIQGLVLVIVAVWIGIALRA